MTVYPTEFIRIGEVNICYSITESPEGRGVAVYGMVESGPYQIGSSHAVRATRITDTAMIEKTRKALADNGKVYFI